MLSAYFKDLKNSFHRMFFRKYSTNLDMKWFRIQLANVWSLRSVEAIYLAKYHALWQYLFLIFYMDLSVLYLITSCDRCLRQTMLTQSGAPGRVID